MSEPGGPATESGIFFQNQIAALYLGRLIDPRPRPGYEAVLEVRVEAPEPITVDDVVLRFADGHREYLQVKEAVAPGSEAWKKLWRDFAVQRGKEDFTEADRIVLWLGSHHGWSGILKKLCKTAGGSKDEGEWHRRLNGKAKEMLESLEPILAEHLEGRSALSLLACCKVETSEAERIRSDLVPSFMPESNLERWQLYDTLLRKTAEHARFRKPFSKGELLRELAQEGVEILGSAVPPEVLLEIWLDRVVRVDRELLRYFERQGAPLLEHVYVELELDPQPAGLAARPGEDPRRERLLGRRMSIREVLDLDPAEHPGITRRWLLKGDPGSGKTTLLRHLARKLAEDGGKPWVPVFESLPRLLREPRSLFEGIEEELRRADLPGAEVRRALESEAEEGRLLFLLDGLDEVPEELRERAERFLGDLAQSWPKSPVVVATRPIGAGAPGPRYRELQVLELDAERRRAFLAQWFARDGKPDKERADEIASVLEADRSLRELASNPLYVTLLALLVEQAVSPVGKRSELYGRVFRMLLKGEHRQPPTPMERPAAVRRMLRHLAYGMTEENCASEPRDALEDRLYRDEATKLREDLERVARWRPGLSLFLDDLARRSGIVGPHDGPEADWRFWHRTFREGLTAEQLAEAYERGGRVAIVEHARRMAQDDLSRWAEPYALLTGLIKEPDDLVLALVEESPALGLRALATAQGLRDETLSEILKLSEKWQERAEVYARVPELVDDPIRALALLDTLRRRTRNGNDLFFLEQAVAAVGEKPGARRAAAELQGRFYDHIEAPAADLFWWVETPLDGRVELWREIPPGKFEMGSLPDEEGSLDDERPRHQVSIRSPFWLASVPVTIAQYAAFDPEHRSYHQDRVPERELDHHPVEQVTWYQAWSFCRWLSATLPWLRGARLPAEEEWEYACRAGTKTRYSSGNDETDLARVGWYDKSSGGRTHRVGEKPANSHGLYDMHGNVWEWTRSPWTNDYSGREGGIEVDPSAVDPADLAEGPRVGRVVRGGSCRSFARDCRSACRWIGSPWDGVGGQGFRVLLSSAPSRPSIADHRS